MGTRQSKLIWSAGITLLVVALLGGAFLIFRSYGNGNLARDKKEVLKYINDSSLREPGGYGYATLGVVKDFRVFSKNGDMYALEADVYENGGPIKGGVKGSVRVRTREGATDYEFHLEYTGVSPLRSDNSTLHKSH